MSGAAAPAPGGRRRRGMTLPLRLLCSHDQQASSYGAGFRCDLRRLASRSMAAKEKGSSRLSVLSNEGFYYGEDLLLLVAW